MSKRRDAFGLCVAAVAAQNLGAGCRAGGLRRYGFGIAVGVTIDGNRAGRLQAACGKGNGSRAVSNRLDQTALGDGRNLRVSALPLDLSGEIHWRNARDQAVGLALFQRKLRDIQTETLLSMATNFAPISAA